MWREAPLSKSTGTKGLRSFCPLNRSKTKARGSETHLLMAGTVGPGEAPWLSMVTWFAPSLNVQAKVRACPAEKVGPLGPRWERLEGKWGTQLEKVSLDHQRMVPAFWQLGWAWEA